MTTERFYKVHAPIAHGGFNRILAAFLFAPDQSGAATRHYAGYTVVDGCQIPAMSLSPKYLLGFFILTGICHTLSDRKEGPALH
jgi:hypothetical protein